MIELHHRRNDRQPWTLVATVATVATALDAIARQGGSGDWWLHRVPAASQEDAA